MNKICRNCQKSFVIDQQDQAFYQKIKVPEPTFCPDCRQQRRLAFRNERNLYKRICDLTKKPIITIYSPDKPYKVYDQEAWWGDNWDATTYGKAYDFNRPFFEQFEELLKAVPHPGAGFRYQAENCEYTTYQNASKNCYLTFGSGYMEDCAYTNWTYYAKNSFDILGSENLELCYELVDCKKMYASKYCQDCSNLTDCSHCYDCHSCENCFGCVGLRQKKFNFLNQQLTPEQYKEKISNLDLQQFLKDFTELKQKAIHRAKFELNCENCSGDHLLNCKNVKDSFYATNSQDCKFQVDVINNKDSYDNNRSGDCELNCEAISGGDYYNCQFIAAGEANQDSQYCILNKQYTKEEYEALLPKIIEHMKSNGEYGEFFPITISPFAYNETLAQEFYPLTQEQIKKIDCKFKEKDIKEYLPQKFSVPTKIKDIKDDIVKEILACKNCGKNYKIVIQELKFYRQNSINIPEFCPDCRHQSRITMRMPRQLWDRNCDNCDNKIQTTYSPEKPEIVFCEKCYLESVY